MLQVSMQLLKKQIENLDDENNVPKIHYEITVVLWKNKVSHGQIIHPMNIKTRNGRIKTVCM